MSHAHPCWSERFTRYQASGQTVAAFCATERVSESNFYRWKAKFDRLTAAPVTLIPIQLTATSIAPIAPVAPAAVGSIELVLPSGLLLRLPGDYATAQLATLIAAVEARSC